MLIRRGEARDVDAAAALVERCRLDLNAHGIFQWDESYPSREYFEDMAAAGMLMVLVDEDQVRAVTVLNEYVFEEWSTMPWQYTHPVALHAFAVDPPYQRQGYGDRLLRFCEEWARAEGYGCLRLDAFSEHAAALRFYERRGFEYRGWFVAEGKPAGHQIYYVYEKAL